MSFLLRQSLPEPGRIPEMDLRQVHQLVAEARSSRLLASLTVELEAAGVLEQLPHAIRRHFDSALLVHEKQARDLAYDSEKIRLALASAGEKLVLLKGGAYMLAGLPVGRGRLITDIDIIVPAGRIGRAEQALNDHGWESNKLSDYDEHYYRKWGHEVPPLSNHKRGTTLDLHHNILPPTSGNVDADLLFEELLEVKPGVFTLSWQDMVIHSATHLFHEGEFHHGLRDLWDLDRMLRDFPGRDPLFWDNLVSRAQQLELTVSLYHGLNYVQQVFATPVPPEVLEEATNLSRRIRQPLMDFMFRRAFRPNHPDCRLPFTGLALELLYVRSHYLRMPLYMLLPHLVRKAWVRRFSDEGESPEEDADIPGG